MYVCIYLCVCVCVCVCIYICTHIEREREKEVYIHGCMHIYGRICIYSCACVRTHTQYTHTLTHIYIDAICAYSLNGKFCVINLKTFKF